MGNCYNFWEKWCHLCPKIETQFSFGMYGVDFCSDSFASVPKVAYETKYSRIEQVKFVEDSH